MTQDLDEAGDELERGIPMECSVCGTEYVWHIEEDIDDGRCANCRACGGEDTPESRV